MSDNYNMVSTIPPGLIPELVEWLIDEYDVSRCATSGYPDFITLGVGGSLDDQDLIDGGLTKALTSALLAFNAQGVG